MATPGEGTGPGLRIDFRMPSILKSLAFFSPLGCGFIGTLGGYVAAVIIFR